MSYTRFVRRRYTLDFPARRRDVEENVLDCIADWQPSLIVPCDDVSTWFLHDTLRRRADDEGWARAMPVLRASLCDPGDVDLVERKSLLPRLAERAGVRTPAIVRHDDLASTLAWARARDFNVAVKTDYTAGGNGVSLCRSSGDLRSALERPADGRETVGRRPSRFVQEIVPGKTCCVVGVARGGRTLATFSFEPVTSASPVSPSCVIRRVAAEDLEVATGALVRASRYSGFFAVDFIRCSASGRPHVIDFNGRVSQSTHLGRLMGANLCGALHRSLVPDGAADADPAPAVDTVALFPSEWRRDPESAYLTSSYHDVPWGDPHLLNKLVGNRE